MLNCSKTSKVGLERGRNDACLTPHLDPISGPEEVGVELFFRRAGLRLPVVAPRGARRQRHEDRFGAPARLQTEQGAAVVHQIEFDIAAAPVGLEFFFSFTVWQIFPSFDYRAIRREEMISHGAGERKGKIEVAIGEVIEEDAADAARLAAVAQVEILVALALEADRKS